MMDAKARKEGEELGILPTRVSRAAVEETVTASADDAVSASVGGALGRAFAQRGDKEPAIMIGTPAVSAFVPPAAGGAGAPDARGSVDSLESLGSAASVDDGVDGGGGGGGGGGAPLTLETGEPGAGADSPPENDT